jgi:LacI family transcriptional regulator
MTIKDVARLAGVSISTVSRVINKQNMRISTKQKVLRVIEKYEYHPNAYAQYLGQRNNAKTNTKTETVSK